MCRGAPKQPKPVVIGTPQDPNNTVDRQADSAVDASGLRRRASSDIQSGTLLGQAPAAQPNLGA